ncbi:hypothetical protein [Clostridium intestinale]|uniref:hypothetical protein n=1 Tax=Clostridium intestinale TaxID=36845 RepID=UPI002DD67D4F|nr:hypothetical protein [Clostridium intestinale]WRY52309.1 hypothetical protein P8F83_03735 [Clostridium intestinale]
MALLIKHKRPIIMCIKTFIKKYIKEDHQKVYQEAQHKYGKEINIDGTSKTSDQKDKKD